MNADMEREALLESVALYALGVLPDAEAAVVARIIATDDEARAEYHDLRNAADAVGMLADEPVDSGRSARMRERLLANVRDDVAVRRGGRRSVPNRAWFWGTGLAAAAALVFAFVTVVQDVGLRSDLAATQRRSTTLSTQLAQTERVEARNRQTISDLLAPDARRYEVAQGEVVVHQNRLYVALAKLPPPPAGHVYQAWFAAKGTTVMTPSVTFTPARGTMTIVPLPADAARVGVVAVSVEPEGGSKSPTTKPTFVRPLT